MRPEGWSVIDGESQLGLMRSLDDPTALEYPRHYDLSAARRDLVRLAARFSANFGADCPFDVRVEDASFLGRIEIPASATATGERLVVVVSNFGRLAVLCLENPGVWTDQEVVELLAAEDADRIREGLSELGYAQIAEDPLSEPYDGSARSDRSNSGRVPTWRDRFFSYV
jgi:hypothetical protein